jgi:nucleoside-diphosphate-sugar epimerase
MPWQVAIVSVARHSCKAKTEGMNEALHVIFGTGQIGNRIARRLVARGHRVRMVSRSAKAASGIEAIAGDARDITFAIEAARGAAVVYDTLNPLYPDWKRDLVALGAGPLQAAIAHRAKLVALDCLYMYGAPTGPMTETSPVAPISKKGALRAELAALRLDALARGDASVAIARASDFFGPDLPNSWFGHRFFERALAGKSTECLGDPDQLHSYTYADDVAAALVDLGAAGDATGVWHVPTLPATTTRELVDHVAAALGTPIAIKRFSRVLLRIAGLAMPLMRELPEMAYQWESPFVLDDSKFRTRFGAAPTPLAEQLATTVAWARSAFGEARSAAA